MHTCSRKTKVAKAIVAEASVGMDIVAEAIVE